MSYRSKTAVIVIVIIIILPDDCGTTRGTIQASGTGTCLVMTCTLCAYDYRADHAMPLPFYRLVP